MRTENRKCRECGLPLRKVAPRNIIEINEDAKMAQTKYRPALYGAYCSADCALDAYARGVPKTKENTK